MVETKRAKGDAADSASLAATLGLYLASIRKDRRLSLRAVEEMTRKQVSNAYLSQIEHGQIKQPSPNTLNALAELYQISLEKLMVMAGYMVQASSRKATDRHGRVPTFAEHNLTPDEEEELMRYLEFIRNRKK
jgi:HTH-type transcriptional regulator, competence development regulator